MKTAFTDTIGEKIFENSTTMQVVNLADSSIRYAIKYLLQATATIKEADDVLSQATDSEIMNYWESAKHYAIANSSMMTAILSPYFPGKRIVTTARNLVTASTTDEEISRLVQTYIETI